MAERRRRGGICGSRAAHGWRGHRVRADCPGARGRFDSSRRGRVLDLHQPVRRVDGVEIGTVMGLVFGSSHVALVRWGTESTFEAVDDLVEVRLPRR